MANIISLGPNGKFMHERMVAGFSHIRDEILRFLSFDKTNFESEKSSNFRLGNFNV